MEKDVSNNDMPEKYNQFYDKDYFKERDGNDLKRQKSFDQEKQFINKYIKRGNLLDIGCSTGEFIKALNWEGATYGMEVSEYAAKIAKENNVLFDKDIFNTENFFDLIIFRGTIQHIDTPFLYLKSAYKALKPGGFVYFLAPNARSICYKLWNTMPFLDPAVNFYIPSDQTLINAMKNFGFVYRDIHYPYLHSPYSSLLKDHLSFLLRFFGFKVKFPFWGNLMCLIMQKPEKY